MKLDLNEKRTIRNRKKLKKVNVDRYRITVSKSLNNISAQIIDDRMHKTIVSASSNEKKIKGLNNGKYYHVHSYYCKPDNQKNITHFINFNDNKICVSYMCKKVLGVQFHHEKSRDEGIDFLKFFASIN